MVNRGQLLNPVPRSYRFAGLNVQGLPIKRRIVSASKVGRPGSAAVLGTSPAEGVVHRRAAKACHHGGARLAAVAVGRDAVSSPSVAT